MIPIKRAAILTKDVIKDAQDHARAEYLAGGEKPRESIGFAYNGKYIPLENKSPFPDQAAKPAAAVWAKVIASKKIDCLIHSHPDGPFYPSGHDMASQVALNIPHGVLACYQGAACSPVAIWGDRLDALPLDGRVFQHGITDCYEAVRDIYRVNNIINLPPVPRNWDWWRDGLDLYGDYFEKVGFTIVSAAEVKPFDGVLFKIPTRNKENSRLHTGDTYNHAAVYVGPDAIYHHPSSGEGYSASSLSGVTGLAGRIRDTTLFIRPPAK